MVSTGAIAKSNPASFERVDQATARYGSVPGANLVKIVMERPTDNASRLLVCGDSEPDPGEECDDGNTTSGDGCSATCTIEAGFDCSPAIPGQLTQNIMTDGSFAGGGVGWTDSGTPFPPICTSTTCAGGSFDLSIDEDEGWYWSGGAPSASVTSASQTLVIPATASTLTFEVWEAFCVPDNNPGDFLTVSIDGNEVFNSGVCVTEGFYAQPTRVIDLATAPGGPYNDGASHTVTVDGVMDFNPGDPQTGSIIADDFRINIPATPPVPPVPSSCTAVVCGDGVFPQFSAAGSEECDDGNTTAGDGCSATCTIEQPNFVCEDPVPAAASGEDVDDGGLEEGAPNPFWTETGTQFEPICSQIFCGAALANDGAFYAWFGGSSLPNAQTLSQDVVISSTATTLTFDLLIGRCDSANDTLTVDIDGTTVYTRVCSGTQSPYAQESADISAFADGNVHTLTFTGNTVATNGANSNFFVDNISIEDNVAFAGEPGSCFELPTACSTPEQFEAGIPAGWTVVNLGPDPTDGWGTSNDGICASQNWSTTDPANNVTNGGGVAACADSDATGQIDVDGGGTALEMDTYLCTPSYNLTSITDPQLSFLVNYQAADNDAIDDNGTPDDTSDDRDLDLLRVLVGTQAPNALTVGNYTSLGNVFDHLDGTLAISEEAALAADLSSQLGQPNVWACFHYRGTYAWFAQVDNVALRASDCTTPPADQDGDGVPDGVDNCLCRANADQRDTDGDGFGNACDADLNNDGITNPIDLGLFRSVFFTPDPDADLNGDGIVNPIDLGIFRSLFFQPAGGICP